MRKQLIKTVNKRWRASVKALGIFCLSILGMNSNSHGQTLEPPLLAPVVDVANGTATFSIRINGGLGACAASTLDIIMPTGYEISAGSFTITSGSSVVEASVSGNTANLSIGAIPMTPGYVEIMYQAAATCDVIGSSVTNINYSLATCGGPSTASGIVNARNAIVNIIAVTNSSYTGFLGDIYSRVITLRNDGYGEIDTIYLQSTNGIALTVSSVVSGIGTLTDMGGGLYRIVGPSPDGTLRNGEEFTVTETVLINSCTGSLTSAWKSFIGIDGEECIGTGSNQTGGASINTSVQPTVVFSNINSPVLKCLPTGTSDGWVVFQAKNTSSAPALFTSLVSNHSNSACHACSPTVNATGSYGGNTCGTRTMYIDTAAGVSYSMDGGITWSPVVYAVHQSWDSWTEGGGYNAGKPISLQFSSGIPQLDGGDSVRIRFKLHDEPPPCCIADWYQASVSMGAAYTDVCGNNPKNASSGGTGSNAAQRYSMNSTTEADAIGGETYNLTYSGFIIHNTNATRADGTGYIDYEITLPTSLDPSTLVSDHSLARGTTVVYPTSVTWDAETRKLRLHFLRSTLPSINYENWSLSVKTTVDCTGTGGTAFLSAYAKLSSCATEEWQVLCNREAKFTVHGCDPSGCEGALNYATKVKRTNYGIYSATNDGIPGGTLDVNHLNLNRTINGDTVAVTTTAKIVGAISFSNIFVEIIKSETDAVHPFVDATAYIYNASGMIMVSGIASGTVSGVSPSTRVLNINTGMGAPVSYAPGDSIVVVTRFRQLLAGDKRVDFTTTTYASNSATFGDVSQAACDADWTGTIYNIGTGIATNGDPTLSMTECSPTSGGFTIQYQVNPSAPATTKHARFPYEIRKMFELDTLRIVVPTGFEITNMKITVNGQNAAGVTGITSYPLLSYNSATNTYYYDLSTLENTFLGSDNHFSEGFILVATPTFKAVCKNGNFGGADNIANLRVRARQINASWVFSGGVMYLSSSNSSFLPLTITTASPNKTVSTNSVSWDVQITNTSPIVKPNVWLAEASAINGLTINSVEELSGAGGAAIGTATLTGGIYQLGNLSATTSKYFRVNATFSDCVKDSMTLITDYNCEAYPSSLAAAEAGCKVRYLPVTVVVQSAILQLAIINQPTAAKNLCELVDYELEVTNAGLGGANTLFININGWSNSGMQFVSGSLEFQEPGGTYVSMPDANFAALGPATRRIVIPVATLSDLGPTEKYKVKFQIKTLACDFVSGSRLNFTPQGRNGCNLLISGTTNSSNKINIIGAPEVVPTYTIVSSVDTLVACGGGTGSTTYRFKLVNTGSLISGSTDGWRVRMPEGWTLNTGSVDFTHNPTGTAMFTDEEDGNYDFNIGSGLAIGDSVVFTATIISDEDMAALECGAGLAALIVEQGFVKFNASCIDPLITCELIQLLEPVNETTTINVVKPSYDAILNIDEDATRHGFNVVGSIVLNNTSGVYVPQDATISIYHDLNTNGVYDTGDTLIGSHTAAMVDEASQTVNFSIPSGQTEMINYGSLVAVAALECACADASAYYTNVVLPVDFVFYKAEAGNCSVLVQFETGSENNNERFDILHSKDAISYMKVGEVKSKAINGNSSSVLSYEFVHQSPVEGANYYQIRQVNVDGRITKTNPVKVNVTCEYDGISLHPNPSSDVVFVSGATEGSEIAVLNNLGQKMNVAVSLKGKLYEFNVQNLSDGVYHVIVSKNGKETGVLKLIVSKK